MPQQPIIVDVEGVGELEFPSGTDEIVIQQTVKRVIGDQRPLREFGPARFAIEATRTPPKPEMLPTAGGMLGSALGPIGAAVGGGAGAAARNLYQGRPITEGVATDAAIQGAAQLLGPLISKAKSALVPIAQKGHDVLMKGALKMDRGYLNKMTGPRGDLAAKEQRILNTVRGLGVNPTTRAGGERIQSAIEDIAAKRTAKIAAAPDEPVPRSGRAAEHAGRRVTEKIGRGEAPRERLATSRGVVEQIKESPRTGEAALQRVSFAQQPTPILDASGRPITRLVPIAGKEIRRAKDLTPQQLAETIEETNNELRGLFGDAKLGPRAETLMGIKGARGQSLDLAARTGPLSRQMRDLIDVRNVSQIARRRADAYNPIGLTDVISLSAGRPTVLAASMSMKPKTQGALAALLGRKARTLAEPGASEVMTPQLARLLHLLLTSHEQE
jgi:hypothetical protein